jgi:hypothetical protein
MAEEEIERLVEEARTRWPLIGATVIHRYGRLVPGSNIVLVVTASTHRGAAFAAAEFLMGLAEDQGAVLEAGRARRRRLLGRGEGCRRRGRDTLGAAPRGRGGVSGARHEHRSRLAGACPRAWQDPWART